MHGVDDAGGGSGRGHAVPAAKRRRRGGPTAPAPLSAAAMVAAGNITVAAGAAAAGGAVAPAAGARPVYNVKSAEGFSLPLAADSSRQEGDSEQLVADYSELMEGKPGCEHLPLVILPTGYIYVDVNCPAGKAAEDLLVTLAEPVSRPENIREFQITVFSLYAAVGVGMTVEDIVRNLERFSRNRVPKRLVQLLNIHGNSFGRVKLVLREGRYLLEAATREDLEYMLSNRTIAEARIRNTMATRQLAGDGALGARGGGANAADAAAGGAGGGAGSGAAPAAAPSVMMTMTAPVLDPNALGFKLTQASREDAILSQQQQLQKSAAAASGEADRPKLVYMFEVMPEKVSRVKECALTELQRPLVFEYDFRKDKNPALDISLRPATKIRYYQERALRKMFSNGRARSGIIVLPCGAGKTLTGITAATTIRRSAMILTSSTVAVDQWKRSFVDFTTVNPRNIVTLTSERKSDLPEGEACVLVSTYTMMSYSGRRSDAAERILQQIRSRDWGLLIFDEVQFAPAPAFRKINDLVKSHCKLGLTATLVREDDLIHDLQWLIGPKLYEANWLELQEAGYLAKVQVSEVWCPMTAPFYAEYLTASHAKQRKLWVCNPNKLRVCEYLLRFHEARKDKLIVFSDNLFALKEVAFTLKRPFVSGEVGMQERLLIINRFKTSNQLNTIFLSKVGDNAIDIPCANVVIQISFNFASRRQEAQRLGRILRPKPKANEDFNAFFYSLVSKDTQEMLYADKRQQFIIDQGYAYKVLPISVFPMENETLLYDCPNRQAELLRKIQSSSDAKIDLEEDDVVLTDTMSFGDGPPASTAGSAGAVADEGGALDMYQAPAGPKPPNRVKTSLAMLSGGGVNAGSKPVHPFFRSLKR